MNAPTATVDPLLRPYARQFLESLASSRGAEESFSSIVNAARAALAERYLANDRNTLTGVSELLGFTAPSAFSRWFRSRFGSTPSQWRDAAQLH